MTTQEIYAIYEEISDEEFLKFDRVNPKRSRRSDLHAFLLLDELMPSDRDMVSDAAHDEIWLEVDLGRLAEIITRDQLIELVRCGVRFDSETESFAMFT